MAYVVAENKEATAVEFAKSSAVLIGLKSLIGINEVDLSKTDAGFELESHFDDVSAVFSLDADMTLVDIKVKSTVIIDEEALLLEASSLPPPQDLRYAIFGVKAASRSAAVLQKHVSEMRKSCVVRVPSRGRLHMIFRNGLNATIALHQCYPEVPAGVFFEALTGAPYAGETDASEEDLLRNDEDVKALLNSKCFRSILHLHRYMLKEKMVSE